jgi:hypothetical protein
MTEPDNGIIKFTVKEWLLKLDTKLDTALVMLAGKADNRDLMSLENRFNELKTQVDSQNKVNEAIRVQAEKTAKQSTSNLTRKQAVILSGCGVAALGIQLYAALGG